MANPPPPDPLTHNYWMTKLRSFGTKALQEAIKPDYFKQYIGKVVPVGSPKPVEIISAQQAILKAYISKQFKLI